MAVIYHEGLPGSGKSYEAVVKQIIPALQAGRSVDAYIEGLNHAKIAEVAGLPVEEVEHLLKVITRDQVERIWELKRPNSLIVIDEAQNFWPGGRQRLGPEVTQFVTEHRHEGQDILLMGQDIRDVHALWRRRVAIKMVYTKMDGIGAGKRYNVTVYKASSPDRFTKMSSAIGKYDPKYFGTYSSHVNDSIQTADFKDSRATVAGTALFKYGIPISLVLAVWGAYEAYSFFHPANPDKSLNQAPGAVATPNRPSSSASAASAASAPDQVASAPLSFIGNLNAKYRPRVAMLFVRTDGVPVGILEWWEGDRVRERLSISDVVSLGEAVTVIDGSIVKIGQTFVTRWPANENKALPQVGAQVVPLSTVSKPGT